MSGGNYPSHSAHTSGWKGRVENRLFKYKKASGKAVSVESVDMKSGLKKSKKDEELEAEMEHDKEAGSHTPAPEELDGEVVEVLEPEAKSIIISLLSQLRPGMDLSRVTLPTFILEPKSFLEKITDFMSHPEILINTLTSNDPVERMVSITKFYMSGFYVRPKGVKKPYNPLLGELFRCSWDHSSENLFKSFYVSEQVSHHPPVSAFYGQNRRAGVVMQGSMEFRSSFMGNSLAAILTGEATIHLLNHDNETYTLSFPTVYARGILWGTLLMELGGEVIVKCEKSGLESVIEFKTKPWVGGEYNAITGKITQNHKGKKKPLYTLKGKWDESITIKDAKGKKDEVLWDATKAVKRYPMIVRSIPDQHPYESRRLWLKVSNALKRNDQEKATDEKLFLENRQRAEAAEREEKGLPYEAKFFTKDEDTGRWFYKYADLRPYNPNEEGEECEEEGVIRTLKRGEQLPQQTTSSGSDDV